MAAAGPSHDVENPGTPSTRAVALDELESNVDGKACSPSTSDKALRGDSPVCTPPYSRRSPGSPVRRRSRPPSRAPSPLALGFRPSPTPLFRLSPDRLSVRSFTEPRSPIFEDAEALDGLPRLEMPALTSPLIVAEHDPDAPPALHAIDDIFGQAENVGFSLDVRELHQLTEEERRRYHYLVGDQDCSICRDPLAEPTSLLHPQDSTADVSSMLPAGSLANLVGRDRSGRETDGSATLRAMPCPARHVYHGICIAGWLKQHTTCPECRFDAANFETETDRNDELPLTVTLDATPPPPATFWAGSPVAMYGARPQSQPELRVPMVDLTMPILAMPVPLVGSNPLHSTLALERSFETLGLSSPLLTPADPEPSVISPPLDQSFMWLHPALSTTGANEPTATQAASPSAPLYDQHTVLSNLDASSDGPHLDILASSHMTSNERSFAAALGARWAAERDSWTPAQSTSRHVALTTEPFADFINRATFSNSSGDPSTVARSTVAPSSAALQVEQLPVVDGHLEESVDDDYGSDDFAGSLVLPIKPAETTFEEWLAHRELVKSLD